MFDDVPHMFYVQNIVQPIASISYEQKIVMPHFVLPCKTQVIG